ncbi:2-oxo acid dehydrogenase subunit E2 [Enterobacteriaceae endosymbiont of Macroplea appendiculata]|uniref:2-oxo acid dehydrogenase subunit E2 n=1 Tax=Enterobacteriaceae endosymbiont of Macroplea appendiculata TaxID=2675790 RepID=UPI001448F345|nr:2-oxo acid dehydrogenase subunit E2 [Enterobacteriaceae endosymbiont of Macroplea appendiculata]QJC30824.1 hypothetical protein GJT86_01055 [Enterobacteriaceae endosymbiont of Macroplea appendiculata]
MNNNIIILPDIGNDNMKVTEILVQVGDYIHKDQSIIVVESDKTSIEVPADQEGEIQKICVNIGDIVQTNSQILILLNTKQHTNNTLSINTTKQNKTTDRNIILNNTKLFNKKNDIKEKEPVIQKKIEPEYFYATPYIRKIARQFNINLSIIKGSGNKNRIVKEDIMRYIKDNNFDNIRTNTKNLYEKYGPVEIVILNNIQKTTSVNLTNNWKNIPHVTQHIQADITELESFRTKKNYELKKTHNIKITILSFIIKICAHALKQFPYFNSSILDNKTLIIKKYYNIGIAVNTPKGLVVPIIFNVLDKNIIEISKEIILLANKAKNNKLIPQDLKGGCFTISNLGQLRSNFFTPIINAPEVSILGISQAMIQPIWNNDKFIPRLMLPLSLSYDHRIINGVDGVMFLNFICDLISDIRNLLI